ILRAAAMVKGRANLVDDLWEQAQFFFEAPTTYAEKDVKKRWSEQTPEILRALIEKMRQLPSLESKAAEEAILAWISEKGYHLGNVMNALRLAVVGACKGPHMFDITELMGIDETARRVEAAIAAIPQP
ncbi:MAG: glutamate--tRNA ligase, partial [Muribaculaceae bacterium]|nr:glutamate--tRNA ligase [Muribaculaceae bacterium]